eukprot:4491825-Alexandrium_andersonii.AAC.1
MTHPHPDKSRHKHVLRNPTTQRATQRNASLGFGVVSHAVLPEAREPGASWHTRVTEYRGQERSHMQAL